MQSILIVRTSAIGDIVFASPIADAIRRAHPQASVSWLVEEGLAPLLDADPAIDRVIEWPRRQWQALWRERRFVALARAVLAFRRKLREHRFDTVLDLQGLLKSGLLAWFSGAPRRVGLGGFEGSRWLMTEIVPKGGVDGRISSEYAFLAETLGLPAARFVPRIHARPEAVLHMRDRLAEAGVPAGRYVVFAPFTTRPQKHWGEAAWRALAQRAEAELGLRPVVLGGPGEREAAERIFGGLDGVCDLSGTTSLAEAVAVVRDAALVIGVDTGLTHAGIGFSRPTVAIFGSTCPYRDAGRRNARVIWLGLSCSPCRRRPQCDGAFDCLAAIDPDRVLAEARAARGEAPDTVLPLPARGRASPGTRADWSSPCLPLA